MDFLKFLPKEQVLSFLRSLLKGAGSLFAGYSWATGDEINMVIGGIVAAVGMLFSYLAHKSEEVKAE